NKELNKSIQGPLTGRDIPRPMLLSAPVAMSGTFPVCGRTQSLFYTPPPAPEIRSEIVYCASMTSEQNDYELCRPMAYKDVYNLDFEENGLVQLISLQNANGSWHLNEDLAKALGMSLEDMNVACPDECMDSSDWATILAVLWLHSNGKDFRCEWELLERKAVAWICTHAGAAMPGLVKAADAFLKSSMDLAIFSL
ncbi:von Willebrand factor A domain-containing protein 5A-like, partial [Tupaia chinensis]|uniref:von Willebrand factor A domain-containing protein 5A-like n=1 Tax=Tupaia chinensis TaxID=246437 RepID=UPI0003C8D5CA